jgi:hypothetical protein
MVMTMAVDLDLDFAWQQWRKAMQKGISCFAPETAAWGGCWLWGRACLTETALRMLPTAEPQVAEEWARVEQEGPVGAEEAALAAVETGMAPTAAVAAEEERA